MIGSIVSIVAAARTEVGVTDPAAFFIASTEFPWFVTEDNNFISSYCKLSGSHSYGYRALHQTMNSTVRLRQTVQPSHIPVCRAGNDL